MLSSYTTSIMSSTLQIPTAKLNTGAQMPLIGMGTYGLGDEVCRPSPRLPAPAESSLSSEILSLG